MLNTLAVIADRKAGFRSLGDAWADTTTNSARPLDAIRLSRPAEFERNLIRACTSEGRERSTSANQN
jgi:DNA invertase Pin-like site-specific DNA recombinase